VLTNTAYRTGRPEEKFEVPRLVGGFVFVRGDKMEFADVPYGTAKEKIISQTADVVEENILDENDNSNEEKVRDGTIAEIKKNRTITLREVKYEGFKLAKGQASFTMPTAKAKSFQKALLIMNDNFCYAPLQGRSLDEIYCGDSLFRAWHRKYDITTSLVSKNKEVCL